MVLVTYLMLSRMLADASPPVMLPLAVMTMMYKKLMIPAMSQTHRMMTQAWGTKRRKIPL